MDPTASIKAENARFMTKVYGWMVLGLAVTAGVSYLVASNPDLVRIFILNKFVFYGLLILQLIEVITFGALLKKLSPTAAGVLFLIYALTMGLTFSVIFLVYSLGSIQLVFLITSIM